MNHTINKSARDFALQYFLRLKLKYAQLCLSRRTSCAAIPELLWTLTDYPTQRVHQSTDLSNFGLWGGDRSYVVRCILVIKCASQRHGQKLRIMLSIRRKLFRHEAWRRHVFVLLTLFYIERRCCSCRSLWNLLRQIDNGQCCKKLRKSIWSLIRASRLKTLCTWKVETFEKEKTVREIDTASSTFGKSLFCSRSMIDWLIDSFLSVFHLCQILW